MESDSIAPLGPTHDVGSRGCIGQCGGKAACQLRIQECLDVVRGQSAQLLATLGLIAVSSSVLSSPVAAADASASTISSGIDHSCSVSTVGGVKCWGDNLFGKLGDGTGTQRVGPVDVTGLTSGVATVSARGLHTCALTTAGGVQCWGWNFHGQLGNGTASNSQTPVGVSGLASGVAAISTGENHSCALTTTGGLKCWGNGLSGQIGDGTSTSRATPVDVIGLSSGVAAVSAGAAHTCALTTAGGLKCWGHNSSGQLGNGTTTDSAIPVDVSGLTNGVTAVSAAESHTCALTTSEGLKCWGNNVFGQLGDGTGTQRHTPSGCHRVSERCRGRLCWERPYLRRDHGRQPQMLGMERPRSAR